MKHTHDIIRDRLLLKAGLAPKPKPKYTLTELELSEWSAEFERLMRNRMLMGALRYGRIEDNRRLKKPYNRLASIHKRLDSYERTGNDELLVDCANLCLLEFELGRHPNKHFTAADSRQHHVSLTTPKACLADAAARSGAPERGARTRNAEFPTCGVAERVSANATTINPDITKPVTVLEDNCNQWIKDFEKLNGRLPKLSEMWP